MSSQIVFSASEVSTVLQIQESTLRKYALLLQNEGYEFVTNELNHRLYTDIDVITFRKMLELKDKSAITLKQAAQAVMSWHKNKNVSNTAISEERYNNLLEEFEAFREQQNSFNQELLKRLDKQQDYIKNSINERDRQLTEALNEIIETKKQIASTEEKSKSWWQFWK